MITVGARQWVHEVLHTLLLTLNMFQIFYKKNCLNYFVRFILTTVCSFSLLYSSSSLSKVPKPRASESSGNLKCKLIGSTPDLLNQKLLGWDQAICVLISSPDSPDTCSIKLNNHYRIVFYYANVPQFIYPFYYWCTYVLLDVLGFQVYRYYKYSCTRLLVTRYIPNGKITKS